MTDHADTIRRGIASSHQGPRNAARAALDALLAERQQAQKELQIETEVLGMAKRMAEDMAIERQQAIDALREIAAPMRGDVTMNERARMARAALVKLGEKP